MTVKQNTRQAVQALARLAVEFAGAPGTDSRNLTAHPSLFAFCDANAFKYRDTLYTLIADSALANLSNQEIKQELTIFLDDILRDHETFHDNKSLRKHVGQFVERLPRSSNRYEIAIGIEGITLPSGEIKIGKTRFFCLDHAFLCQWGIAPVAIGLASGLMDNAVGLVQVVAGSFDRAWELAAQEIDTSLAILRAAMVIAPQAPQMDDLFLQARGAYHIGKQLVDPPTFQEGGRRGFRRITLELDKNTSGWEPSLIATASAVGQTVTCLFDGSLAPGLSGPLLRALEWIGSSPTRDNYDDKVVDLCTAMECMLAVKNDRMKGEAIALRYLILTSLSTSMYAYPHAVLPIYEVRSDVVHGSKRRIATPQQYFIMRQVAMLTLDMVLRLLKSRNDIKNINSLVQLLESDASRIVSVIECVLNPDRSKVDRAIKDYARELIAKANSLNAATEPTT